MLADEFHSSALDKVHHGIVSNTLQNCAVSRHADPQIAYLVRTTFGRYHAAAGFNVDLCD